MILHHDSKTTVFLFWCNEKTSIYRRCVTPLHQIYVKLEKSAILGVTKVTKGGIL